MRIGIDLGGTNIAAGITSDSGELLFKDSIPTQNKRPSDEIVRDMAVLAKRLATDNDIDFSTIKSVGIGIPGATDYKSGRVNCVNIKMQNYPLVAELQKYIQLPVYVDNDANCAAMGEYVFYNGNVQDFLLVTLGTGVGSGMIINGEIYRGFNGAALEGGHMTIVSGGYPCTCGKNGCWECYASVTALKRQTAEAIEKDPGGMMAQIAEKDGRISGKTAFLAAKSGDKSACEIVDRYALYIADGIVSLENIFQPEVIAIGGGISREGEYLLAPIRRYVEKYRYNKTLPTTKLVTAKLLNDAGIVGAAMIAK